MPVNRPTPPTYPTFPTFPTPPTSPKAPSDRLARALELLADEVRARLDRHSGGHLVAGRGDGLTIALDIPTDRRDGQLPAAHRAAEVALDEAIDDLVRHRAAFQPGRVLCLRCGGATCEHSAPSDGRQVFAGWGPTGLPRFLDFGQLLLERRDPRVDDLFREPSLKLGPDAPALVTWIASERELCGALLPAFAKREDRYHLWGQLAAGWFRGRDAAGFERPIAVSFQVVSTAGLRSRPQFGLNVLGVGPEGDPLELQIDRLGALPWAEAIRWAQAAIATLRADSRRPHPAPRGGELEPGKRSGTHGRIEGLLQGLARRLERNRRATTRRTRHAEERHTTGERPTSQAYADLASATAAAFFVDLRRDTLAVVGERGRVHVFNREGRHVTSIRLPPGGAEKRRERGLWRSARPEEVQQLLVGLKYGVKATT